MKIILFISLSILLFSCGKSDKVTISRDCTGTYIVIDNSHYKVCNSEILADKEDGERVKVKFNNNDCSDNYPNTATCYLYHEYESIVEVLEVN